MSESTQSLKMAPQLNGLNVLLVDDSLDNQKLFQRFLLRAGARVVLADNGEQAVQLQEHSEFDVIIMDIRMPVLDGYEASRIIRRRGFSGPIIALTAHCVPGERERCLHAGCSIYLTKPIERAALVASVAEAAARSEIRPL